MISTVPIIAAVAFFSYFLRRFKHDVAEEKNFRAELRGLRMDQPVLG